MTIDDPEFRRVAKALREFLRHEYADALIDGHAALAVPYRLSTYSGKGWGRYAIGADGRADWSPELERYIAHAEVREPAGYLRVQVGEMAAAMRLLETVHPDWHRLLTIVDVEGKRLDDYATDEHMDLSTAKRHRRRATFALYQALCRVPDGDVSYRVVPL